MKAPFFPPVCAALAIGWLLPSALQAEPIASPPEKIPMAGVVSYTDWSHVVLSDPRLGAEDLAGFVGAPGVRKIIETSAKGGIQKLYWRAAGSASAYYVSTFDTDGDGQPDLETASSRSFDAPPYREIYKREALTPDHLIATPDSPKASALLQLRATGSHPAEAADFGVRLAARVTANAKAGNEVYLYIAREGKATQLYPLHATPEAHGKFRAYQATGRLLRVGKEMASAVTRDDLPITGNAIGLYWPEGSSAKVAVNTLEVITLSRLERDKDAPGDLVDLDLGPVVTGLRDQPWSEVLTARNLRINPVSGDPRRRDDFARTYRSPHNPFGPGEDQISCAVREARARGMKIYLWFTVGEENHYGSGPISAFARKHPELREVDQQGNVWRARLSPAFPEVRKYKVGMVQEAVNRYRPDGVLLDFVRRGLRDPYLEESRMAHHPVRDENGVSIFGYDKANLEAFAEAHPSHPVPRDNGDERWIDWRVATHTQWMKELSEAIPGTPVSVVVFSGSAEQSRRGDLLDWQDWARNGLIQEVMFMIDNSTDGRPFVKPFGSPPKPVSSVGGIVAARRQELPPGFPLSAGIYCYRIESDIIPEIARQAISGNATEIAWWETTSLEWTEGFAGKTWERLKQFATPMASPATND